MENTFLSAAAPGTVFRTPEVIEGPTTQEIQQEKQKKLLVPVLIGVAALAATIFAIKKFK